MPSGQFIQMLAALAQIQQGRAEVEQRDRQLQFQREQFTAGLKEQHSKEVADAITTLMKLAPEARQAFVALRRGRWDPTEVQMLEGVMTGQPIDLGVQTAQSSQRGYANMTPERRSQVDTESAGLARTGMQQGQLAQSSAMAAALGGGSVEEMNKLYGARMTQQMLQGAASQTLARQNPFEVAVGASALEQGFAPNMAQMQYQGVQTDYGPMQPYQAGQLDIGRGGNEVGMAGVNQRAIEAAMGAAAQAQSGQGRGVGENLARMANILEQMTGRNAPAGPGREALTGLYNSLAMISGLPNLVIRDPKDIPERKNFIQRMLPGGTGPLATPQNNPLNFFAPPSGAPNIPQNVYQFPQGSFNPYPSRP